MENSHFILPRGKNGKFTLHLMPIEDHWKIHTLFNLHKTAENFRLIAKFKFLTIDIN